MAVTPCCSEKYGSLLLCYRTSQLCSVWLILPAQHGKAIARSTSQVYERGTCNETSTRLLGRYLIGHVYIETIFIRYGKGPGGHCWSNFKARSC